MKRTLVILTLNEIDGVKEVFPRMDLSVADEVMVVDGGSQDGTREYFLQRGLWVVNQQSKGRGEAFRIALQMGTGEIFCFFSPDGNEDPADIEGLYRLVEEGADLAVARRFGKGARNEEDDRLLPFRSWANRAFTFLANLFFNRGPWLQDSINGFRAITRKAWERLHLDAPGYLIEYQMTIRAMKLGLTMREIPTREGPRISGESGAKSIPTGFRFLRGLAREILLGKRF